MSDHPESKSATPSVVEINSDDDGEYLPPVAPTEPENDGIIEIISDVSDEGDNDEIEIVAENTPDPVANDVIITGSQPTANPQALGINSSAARRSRPAEPVLRRNLRRRRSPLYEAPTFTEENSLFLSDILIQHQNTLRRMFFDREGEVSASIMERISREDERDMDRKMELENIHNRKSFRQKQETSSNELSGYTNNISPDQHILCELCGIQLGEGIPQDFTPDPAYDESFVDQVARCHVNAPWFCLRQCFDTDRDLSKRVFSAKCGHVFCGRCIKNIGNRPAKRGKVKEKMSILNPQISAPRKCPAQDCGIIFNKGKRTFTELFL